METSRAVSQPKVFRPVLFGLYLIGGLLVFLFASNTFKLFPTNRNPLFEWGLTLFFLIVMLVLRQIERLRSYWVVAYSLFVASSANALNLYLGNWLGRLLPTPSSQAQLIAIDKLSQSIPVVLAILLLTWWVRDDLGAIFLQKGNLKQGLKFGLISFAVCALIFAVIAILQSQAPSTTGLTATGVSLSTLMTAIPWILVFVFANSIMEELWFRGISLGKLAPFMGVTAAVILTALVFGIPHYGGTYISPVQRYFFPVIVFALGVVNGFVMLKTRSIWGSVLFHAGYDLLVIIPILVSL